MPIHLPPISRRQFLGRALVLGSGLLAAPHALGALRRRTDKSCWALLADTHIAGDRAKVLRNTVMAEHFEKVAVDLLSMDQRPAGVFINGDCALTSGEEADYATLAELLDPLRRDGMNVHLLLGNHDNRERFWAAFQARKEKRPLQDKHVAIIEAKEANWFLLDSLERTNSTPGLLGEAQLAWLAQALNENRRKPAIVLAHHNFGTEVNIGGLKDTEALLEVLRPRTHVKAYIYGHTHRWTVLQDRSGIHLVNLPPVAYIFREGDPSGWVKTTLQSNGMRLELRCIDPAHPAHGEVHQLDWRA